MILSLHSSQIYLSIYLLFFYLTVTFSTSTNPLSLPVFFFFFFNDPATPEFSPLPLPDPLPISPRSRQRRVRSETGHRRSGTRPRKRPPGDAARQQQQLVGRPNLPGPGRLVAAARPRHHQRDRKSTRLNSSHGYISYAVFCLKKK